MGRNVRCLSIDETVRNPQSEKPGAPSQGVGLGQGGGRGAANTRSMVHWKYFWSKYSLLHTVSE